MADKSYSLKLTEYESNLQKEIIQLEKENSELYAPFLQNAKKQYAFGHYLLNEEKVFDDLPNGYKILLRKVMSDILVLQSSVVLGSIEQSYNIIRTILESYVNLVYINTDFEVNMRYYENHKYFSQYQRVQEQLEDPLYTNNPATLRFLTNKEITSRKKYDSIKDDYKNKAPWYSVPLSNILSSNPNLTEKEKSSIKKKRMNFKDLCEFTNNDNMYKTLYPSTSNVAHSTSLTENLSILDKQSRLETIGGLLTVSVQMLNSMIVIGLDRGIEKGCYKCRTYRRMFKSETA
ncbi:DUF5677 domain-containing protein [Priestia megaterium]